MFDNNSKLLNIEYWFIPVDIIMVLSTSLVVILAIMYLIIIIIDKKCHTIAMMLVANSCLCELLLGIGVLSMSIFTLYNDIKKIEYEDSLCVFRGFVGYIIDSLQNYSYFLQSLYRYLIVVYPTRLDFNSKRFQLLIILLTWIFSILCPIPILIKNEIKYNVNNQICQMPFQLSFLTIYNVLCVYIIPVSLTIFIYYKLVRYVTKTSRNLRRVNALRRAENNLKMVRGIVILLMGLTTIGIPYSLFILISFFTSPPIYHFRISFLFIDISLGFVMILLFKITDPLKQSIIKRINRTQNQVLTFIEQH